MAGSPYFLTHSNSMFHFFRPSLSKLQGRCFFFKKSKPVLLLDLISTNTRVLQLSNFPNLDTSKRKTHSQNLVPDKNALKTLTEHPELGAGQDLQIKKTVQDGINDSLVEEEFPKSISKLLTEHPLSSKNALKICKNLHEILQPDAFSKSVYLKVKALIQSNKLKDVFSALEKNLHKMNAIDIQILFKICLFCKYPESDVFMKKLILIIIKSINHYSPIDVMIMYYKASMTLSDEEKYVIALKNICHTYMENCFKDKLKEYPVEKLPVNSLLDVMNGIMFFSMGSHIYPELNNRVLKTVKKLIPTVKSYRQLWKLFKMYTLGVHHEIYEYDEKMCDTFASTSLSIRCNASIACKIMKNLCRIGHLNTSLLDYILEEYKTCSFQRRITKYVLIIFSYTGFSELDENTRLFLVNKFGEFDFSETFWVGTQQKPVDSFLMLNVGLALTGIYNKDILNQAFDLIAEHFDNLNSSDTNLLTLWNILLLHQWVSTLHPSHENKLGKSIVDTLYSLFLNKLGSSRKQKVTMDTSGENYGSADWEKVIMDTFGENYVLTGWEAPLIHIPSSVVVLEAGNKPLDLSSYKTNQVPLNFETIPNNSKIVLIQEVPEALAWEFVNVRALQGRNQLYLQILERLGYDIITLRESPFDNSSVPTNKKDFLISEFENKFGKIDCNN